MGRNGPFGASGFLFKERWFFKEREPWNLMDFPPFGRMATSGPWPPLPIYATAYITRDSLIPWINGPIRSRINKNLQKPKENQQSRPVLGQGEIPYKTL